MGIGCHLVFDGQCETAFLTYQRLLGGAIRMLRYGESPLATQVPAEWHPRILHATLVLDEQELLGSDAFPNAYERPQGIFVTLSVAEPAQAKNVFASLAEDGRVHMPFQETFWSAGYGVLVDRFGVPWEVNCERPPDSR